MKDKKVYEHLFIEMKCKCGEVIKIGFTTDEEHFFCCEGVLCKCGNKIIDKVYKE